MKIKCLRVWYAGRFIGKSYYTRWPRLRLWWIRVRYVIEAWVIYSYPSMEEEDYWDREEDEGVYFTPSRYRKGDMIGN